MANDQGGRKGGAPRFLSVRDALLQGEKSLPGGGFEVEAKVVAYAGNFPCNYASFQYLGDGTALHFKQGVDPSGVASKTLKINKPKSNISILVEAPGLGARIFPLGEVSEPAPPKRRIDPLGIFEKKDAEGHITALRIFLRRVGRDGKAEVGPISAFDFVETSGVWEWQPIDFQMDANKQSITVDRLVLDKPRTIEFFLPDDPGVRYSVSVPGRQTEASKKEKHGLAEVVGGFVSGLKKGKRLYRKHGGVFGALLALKDSDKGESRG